MKHEALFSCPVCNNRLLVTDGSLRCENGHSFDRAKSGYVNLLLRNSAGKRHGDDAAMVAARKVFLDNGYYAPLREAVADCVGAGHRVLDAGCGEGYYTAKLAENNTVCGIDISKNALKYAAKRCPDCEFAVASIAHIPLGDASVDTVVSIFAPENIAEFRRVLSKGGRWITVMPMEDHLWELKCAVYDTPYRNPAVCTEREGLVLRSHRELQYTVTLHSHEDVVSLFQMTPYYYKTSATDQQKLDTINHLTTSVEFYIAEYIVS